MGVELLDWLSFAPMVANSTGLLKYLGFALDPMYRQDPREELTPAPVFPLKAHTLGSRRDCRLREDRRRRAAITRAPDWSARRAISSTTL